jgi:hypothetical protein
MTEGTPEGRESQQPGETGLPQWTSLTDLYLMGAASPSYPSFPSLVNTWLAELNRVVPPTYGRKVAGELTYPPDHDRRRNLLSVRLDNGQAIELRFGAYWEAPRRTLDKGPECLDGGWYRRVEVRDLPSRTDKATLAALSVLEGGGVRAEGIQRIRQRLRGDSEVYLGSEEARLLAFAQLLLKHHNRETDPEEVLVETCKRVAAVAESARQLTAFLEFGAADRKLIPASKDPQMDVLAAELHHIAGMSQKEVAETLRRTQSERMKIKGGHDTAKSKIERGTSIFVRALGEEGWERYRARAREEYERSEELLDPPKSN